MRSEFIFLCDVQYFLLHVKHCALCTRHSDPALPAVRRRCRLHTIQRPPLYSSHTKRPFSVEECATNQLPNRNTAFKPKTSLVQATHKATTVLRSRTVLTWIQRHDVNSVHNQKERMNKIYQKEGKRSRELKRFATARRWLTLFTSTCQRRPPCKWHTHTQAYIHAHTRTASTLHYIVERKGFIFHGCVFECRAVCDLSCQNVHIVR